MMSVVRVKKRFVAFGVILASSLAGILGCGDSGSDGLAGNSAETGSPELASVGGNLFLDGGKPAALVKVQCLPSDFDVFDDSIPEVFKTETDEKGSFTIRNVGAGTYSVEALDAATGMRLLVQDVVVAVGDSGVSVTDTLKESSFALLDVPKSIRSGEKGVASVLGTSIYREVLVKNGSVRVDSLPAGNLDIRLYLESDSLYFKKVFVAPSGTLGMTPADSLPQDSGEVPADSVDADSSVVDSANVDTIPVLDTLVMRFVAPMALPEGSIDSLVTFVSDIPLALRLTPENCNFDTLAGMEGRWQVRRIKTDGGSSKQLPIANAYFDSVAQEAVFWVSIDSLNLEDSLELVFDNTLTSAFARDVFPTNRSYTAVWHFDDGVSPVTDAAEKQNFPGSAAGVKQTDGVVGSGASMKSDSYVVADKSAEANAELHSDFVYDVLELFNFSLWIRLDDLSKEQLIFEKADQEYSLRYDPKDGYVVEVFHIATEVPADSGAKDTVSYSVRWNSGVEGLAAGEWTYVAFSKHGFSMAGNGQGTLFVNDRKVESFTKSSWDGKRSSAADFRLGGFSGALDEFMIGDAFRDDSWTYLTYLNQKPTGYWPQLAPQN